MESLSLLTGEDGFPFEREGRRGEREGEGRREERGVGREGRRANAWVWEGQTQT